MTKPVWTRYTLEFKQEAVRLVHLKAIHAETHGGYGWPCSWKELRAKGKRRFKVTTDSKHGLPIAPNLLNRQFDVAEPDKVWVGAWPTLRDAAAGQGRGHRLGTLVQPEPAALDAGLRQPDAVRARLACGAGHASPFVTPLWGTDSRDKINLLKRPAKRS